MEGVLDELDGPVVRRRFGRWVAVAVGAVLLVLIGVLATREPAKDRLTDSNLLGDVAPSIVGTTLGDDSTDGERFDLDRLRGRWVLVNFFATWCAPCRTEHPELVSFSRRHEQAGDAAVVSIVYGDEADDVRGYFEENGGDWPVLVGGVDGVSLDYGVIGVPESYFVDPAGFVRAKVTGGVTSSGLDRILAELQGRGS